MDRRTTLRAIGVGLLSALAGCGDGGGSDGGPTPTQTADPTTPTATPPPTATETPSQTATQTESRTITATPTATPTDAAQVVDVGDGGFRFEPDSFEITTGEGVLWVWRSSNHNIVPDSIPDGSDWGGTEGGPGTTYERGHVSAFRFTTPGEYTYYCAPHRSAGMTGSFRVVE